jgi:hypothetical protein
VPDCDRQAQGRASGDESVGALAAAVVSPLAAAAVWSWSSAVASTDAVWRRAMAVFATVAQAPFASSARCCAWQ